MQSWQLLLSPDTGPSPEWLSEWAKATSYSRDLVSTPTLHQVPLSARSAPILYRLRTLTLKVHFYLAVGGWENQDCFIEFHNFPVIAI